MGHPARLTYAALHRVGLPQRRRDRSRDAVCFCYHNVVADDVAGVIGDPSLHLGLTLFQKQMEWIRTTYTVVPVHELVGRLHTGKTLKGLASVTFDDGYHGVFHHAVPLLQRMELPATVFLVTDAPDTDRPFWWDRLGATQQLSEKTLLRCRDTLHGDTTAIEHAFPGEVSLPEDLLPARWKVIIGAAPSPLLDVGSHTATHRNLATIGETDLAAELSTSRTTLAERCDSVPHLVSYPYGCTNTAVARAAREAGYVGALALSFGGIGAECDPYQVTRINVPSGLPVETLSCWSAGIRWNPPR